MSFPNPDNYGNSCDCSSGNSTPPPSSIQDQLDTLTDNVTALQVSPFTFTNGGTITMTEGLAGATAGSIDTSGSDENGGSIDTSGGSGGVGGSINTSGSSNEAGGSINTSGGTLGPGGSIDLSGGTAQGSAPYIVCGSGVPSSTLPNGSIYLRVNGTSSTTLYVRAGGSWSALS